MNDDDIRAGHPLRCQCGAWATNGIGVRILKGKPGRWACPECMKKIEAEGATKKRPEPEPKPADIEPPNTQPGLL